ncbi:hypothetical protein [Petrimonas sp.]|uniref:hypothetical protein n=1 Tax=Petrimonas sp. TaxID=2023866 RepID=UPI003F51A4F3
MSTTQRIYSFRDVDMLTASLTITDNAIAAKDFLIEKRPLWADPFFADVRQRVLNAFSSILGISNVKELALQTAGLNALGKTVLKDVAEFKIQLVTDFADNKTRGEELQHLLGFKSPGATLPKYKNNQEALVQLLQRLKTGITPEIRTELEEKGMSPATIDNIVTHANQYLEANVKQETFKGDKKVLTNANMQELNAIYTQVSGIAKVARTFYKGRPVEQDKFSFKKIVKSMGIARGKQTSEEETGEVIG